MATGGYRSHEAFWLGGASAPHSGPHPPPIIPVGGGVPTRRHQPPLELDLRKMLEDTRLEALLREDEELIIILGAL